VKKIAIGLALVVLFIIGLLANPDKKIEVEKSDSRLEQAKVILVSDSAQEMSGKPSVTVYFGESDDNYCELSFHKDSVKSGNIIVSESSSRDKDISLSCNWDGRLYVSSSEHPTIISLKINHINAQTKEAVAYVSAKLVDYRTVTRNESVKFIEFESLKLVMADTYFDNLTK
jgi:hypothetical protein